MKPLAVNKSYEAVPITKKTSRQQTNIGLKHMPLREINICQSTEQLKKKGHVGSHSRNFTSSCLSDNPETFRLANSAVAIMHDKQRRMAEQRLAKQQSELAMCTFKPNLSIQIIKPFKALKQQPTPKQPTINPTTTTTSDSGFFDRMNLNANRQKLKMEQRRDQH